MGLSSSKIAGTVSSPISTPQSPRKNDFDPRSPSTNISRTPLEVSPKIISTIQKKVKNVFLCRLNLSQLKRMK